MALHMDDQCIALPECLGAQTALELFQVQVDPLVILQNLRVKKAFPTTLKLTFVRSLAGVADHVALQGVLVAASLSTFRTNHLLVFVVSSHLVA